MKLNPYLHFAGDAEEAVNFYKNAFDGEVTALNRYGDSPMPSDDDWKQKICMQEFCLEVIILS